jgi:hypothetical protein
LIGLGDWSMTVAGACLKLDGFTIKMHLRSQVISHGFGVAIQSHFQLWFLTTSMVSLGFLALLSQCQERCDIRFDLVLSDISL